MILQHIYEGSQVVASIFIPPYVHACDDTITDSACKLIGHARSAPPYVLHARTELPLHYIGAFACLPAAVRLMPYHIMHA